MVSLCVRRSVMSASPDRLGPEAGVARLHRPVLVDKAAQKPGGRGDVRVALFSAGLTVLNRDPAAKTRRGQPRENLRIVVQALPDDAVRQRLRVADAAVRMQVGEAVSGAQRAVAGPH